MRIEYFQLIDRIIDLNLIDLTIRVEAIVPTDSTTFEGHFPGRALMPGVLLIEAMAQTSGAIVQHSLGQGAGSKVFFMTIGKARFRKTVRPGDLLRMPVKAVRRRGPVFKFEGQVFVGDDLCAEAEYSAMIHDGSEKTA